MEEELDKALISIIEEAANVKDFIVAEAPEVIGQLLRWKMTEGLLSFSLGTLLAAGTFTIFLYLWLKVKIPDEDWILAMLLLIPFSIGAIFAAFNLQWLQILIAPKLYLLEYAASLIK